MQPLKEAGLGEFSGMEVLLALQRMPGGGLRTPLQSIRHHSHVVLLQGRHAGTEGQAVKRRGWVALPDFTLNLFMAEPTVGDVCG